MDNFELLQSRHSVRQFEKKEINEKDKNSIIALTDKINSEHNLHIQPFFNEPKAFSSFAAHYGRFVNCENYIALVGKKEEAEKLGFYGEQILLHIVRLGLSGCWVALTYSKGKVDIQKEKDEIIHCVIAFGYGQTKGVEHKVKPIEDIVKAGDKIPDYAIKGVEAALLAPTGMNQQKFEISFINNEPHIEKKGFGFYTDVDLGIVKYHFELITGHRTNRDY